MKEETALASAVSFFISVIISVCESHTFGLGVAGTVGKDGGRERMDALALGGMDALLERMISLISRLTSPWDLSLSHHHARSLRSRFDHDLPFLGSAVSGRLKSVDISIIKCEKAFSGFPDVASL